MDSLDEDRDGEILMRIVQAAVLSVFRDLVPGNLHRGVVEAFDAHDGVATGDDLGAGAYAEVLEEIPALATAATVVLGDEREGTAVTEPALLASALELVLEGLHLSKRLNKRTSGPHSRYSSRAAESRAQDPGSPSGPAVATGK